MNVQEIGEQGLLKLVQSFCRADLVGDDAAVLTTQPGRSLIVTTDILVDGVHFSDQTTAADDAGWRAAAANLSDLAAMGAMPLGITVGLGLPGNTAVAWVEGLYRGLTECLSQYNTPIVGGDICRSPVITLAITAFGEAEPNQIIRRSTARPGDAIMVTGRHGASKAGLELLLHPEQGRSLSENDRAKLIQAHQRPQPRLDVVALLWGKDKGQGRQKAQGTRHKAQGAREAEEAEGRRHKAEEAEGAEKEIQSPASPAPPHPSHPLTLPLLHPSSPLTPPPSPLTPIAGMDSSDGLADAIVQICRASRVGARLERSQIPVPLTQWVEAQALEWALYGGEDFELVLCLPLVWAQSLVQQLGEGAAIVGTITATPGVWLVDTIGHKSDGHKSDGHKSDGQQPDVELTLERGFQHFGSAASEG